LVGALLGAPTNTGNGVTCRSSAYNNIDRVNVQVRSNRMPVLRHTVGTPPDSRSPDKREVGGSAPRAFGVLAMLDDAANPPGPISRTA